MLFRSILAIYITVRNKASVRKVDGEYADSSALVPYAGRSVLSVGIDEMDESTAVQAFSA